MCNTKLPIFKFIFKCFFTHDYEHIFKAYTCYVIPILKYDSSVLNPHDI